MRNSPAPNVQRKTPVKRAFTGLAGSPLAKTIPDVKSNYTLRVPKTFDREEPVAFDIWFDRFNQKHGRIDLDCSFQECAFDPHLGRGRNPIDNDTPSHAGGERPDEFSPLQDLGVNRDNGSSRKKGAGFSTGLLQGERQIKRRRPTDKTWWIFSPDLFREFIRSKYDPDDSHEAEKAAFVLYRYYHQNREDEQIADVINAEGWRAAAWFNGAKEVKQYRQFLVKQGAAQFADQKPVSTWHGRRSVWRDSRCTDPNCAQCQKNEVSNDYSGRDHIKPEISSGQKAA
jgi:hypothetical protein